MRSFIFKPVYLYLLIAILCFNILEVSAQYFDFTNRRNREIIPFKLINNLIIVPIMINGKGPFNFIVDTGVGILLVTDPVLIDSLDAVNPREITINGIGEGREMRALIHPYVKIDMGNSISGNMPLAILKNEAFDLSSFVGMPIYGLIGYELFNSFIVHINYSVKTLTFYKHETAFIPKKGIKIPISIEDRKPYVNGEVVFSNGLVKIVKLIIDTGAGHPLSLETENGIPYEKPDKTIRGNLGVGLSGMIKGFIGRVPQLRLGKFKLNNIICAFPDYEDVAAKTSSISRNGNLGNNVLKRFNVVFDYSRETMYLKPNLSYKEVFEHDMSGIEMSAEGADYEGIIVSRVEPNSAAALVGIKAGDQILAVNFKSVSDLGMEEINSLLKSRDGKVIVLEVLPSGAKSNKFYILTLKRRI